MREVSKGFAIQRQVESKADIGTEGVHAVSDEVVPFIIGPVIGDPELPTHRVGEGGGEEFPIHSAGTEVDQAAVVGAG